MIEPKFPVGANKLEKCLINSGILAHDEYKKITNGWWLWHGPESFLQVTVANNISKEIGSIVYIDASRSRIEREIGRGPGRPPANGSQRADISVWNKSNNKLRAVIEIKRSIGIDPVLQDTIKMNTWMGQNNPPGSAYMLTYSEAKGAKRMATLDKRFDYWATKSGWIEKGRVTYDDPTDDHYAWGLFLMRHP